jgi:peptide/nickel transport system substrate-binding protein
MQQRPSHRAFRRLDAALVSCALACAAAPTLRAAPRLVQAEVARSQVAADRRIGSIGAVDEFHPAQQPGPDGVRPPLPAPAYGGTITQHIEYLPPSLNHALDNKAVTRWILHAVHETLARLDPVTLEWEPSVARAWDVADLVLVSDATCERLGCGERSLPWNGSTCATNSGVTSATNATGAKNAASAANPAGSSGVRALRGRAEALSNGGYHVRCDDGSTLTLGSADVLCALRGCAVTLDLRADVRWQDGHPFDADDVAFSVRLYTIPGVPAGELRYEFEKIASTEVLGPQRLRFLYREPYYAALDTLLEMCLLPRHLYDLCDPDNAAADPAGRAPFVSARAAPAAAFDAVADGAACAQYITENPRNRMWVGLGPWRVTHHDAETIEAERWDGYFDPRRAGYLDTLRWRYFRDDAAAFQALLAGELDFTYRIASTDYFGAACQSDAFTRSYYKGMFPTHTFGALIWNTRREQLADPRVRRALAHAIDLERFKTSYYRGVAELVTGATSHLGPAYDTAIEPLRHDVARARELLAEAGWEDHDGDGRLDRDGVRFELEFVMQAGNASSNAIALLVQEALRALGGELRISALEGKLSSARVKAREFDVASIAWIPPLEQDQEQLFHSRWAPPGLDSSNYAGFADPEVDHWIEAAQREMDAPKRYALWQRVQRRVYELQPLLYLYSPPRKYALSQRVRGFRVGRAEPGWSARDWYYPSGTPGTRAAR